MSATALRDPTNYGYVLSFLLHGTIVALAWVGVPYLHRDVFLETPPLIVDLVPIEEITSAAPPSTPAPEPAPIPQPEVPEPVQAEAPAAEAMPPPPEEQVPIKDLAKIQPPKVKPIPKPAPPNSKKDDIALLQKLLKDMQKKQPKPQSSQSQAQQPSNNIAPNLSDRASMTELDVIRRHIEGCWRIDPGKEGIENLAAEIKVFINPDGSVQTAQIVDMARYFADPAFRTFVNSARSAVLGCGKIPISPERYNLFKEITMTFSPQGRIN